MKIQSCNTTSFGAIHTANAEAITRKHVTNFGLYKLTPSDREFMAHLRDNIKLGELMPKLPESKLEVWEELFKIATDQAISPNKTGYMLTTEGKPCGLIAFSPSHLDIICTWPVEQGKKVPYAGTVLMKTMFEDFLKGNRNLLDLDAVTNGPSSNVAKFTRLGFVQRGGENYITAMRTTRGKIENILRELNEKIFTTRLREPKNVDLFYLEQRTV